MRTKLHQLVFVSSFAVVAACGDDGPRVDGGDDGECAAGAETQGPVHDQCAPDDEFTVGAEFNCQGEGTGWLIAEVYGAGDANPITSCLSYKPGPVPEYPTSDDCDFVPFDLIPHGIPSPTACCGEDAPEDSIIGTCAHDCRYAACKAAVASIRAAADALTAPNPFLVPAFEVARGDLYAYADVLELPDSLAYCANEVYTKPGEVVSIGLGSGASDSKTLGHIKEATLYISCDLDPDEPYVPSADATFCSEPINVPALMDEQDSNGSLTGGSVTVTGPGGKTSAVIENGSASTREVLHQDMSVAFWLRTFEADIADVVLGPFAVRDAHVSLATPASGWVENGVVLFPPGTLRLSASATVFRYGEPLFGGLPIVAEFGNRSTASAHIGNDGVFQLVEATFGISEYTVMLATEPSVLMSID